jgi:hypothetical protein
MVQWSTVCSCNDQRQSLSEEPIAYTNDEARERLASLADAFLMHDREIFGRGAMIRWCERPRIRYQVIRKASQTDYLALPDQLITIHSGSSRGYAPNSIQLPWDAFATNPGNRARTEEHLLPDQR